MVAILISSVGATTTGTSIVGVVPASVGLSSSIGLSWIGALVRPMSNLTTFVAGVSGGVTGVTLLDQNVGSGNSRSGNVTIVTRWNFSIASMLGRFPFVLLAERLILVLGQVADGMPGKVVSSHLNLSNGWIHVCNL